MVIDIMVKKEAGGAGGGWAAPVGGGSETAAQRKHHLRQDMKGAREGAAGAGGCLSTPACLAWGTTLPTASPSGRR